MKIFHNTKFDIGQTVFHLHHSDVTTVRVNYLQLTVTPTGTTVSYYIEEPDRRQGFVPESKLFADEAELAEAVLRRAQRARERKPKAEAGGEQG